MFLFDAYVTSGDQENKLETTLVALIETLGRLVSLEFLKHCALGEIKVLFYSIWNIAFEAKQSGMHKEC